MMLRIITVVLITILCIRSQDVCYGKVEGVDEVCFGHGYCTSLDTCECQFLFSGEQCQFPKCGHYYSNDPLVCSGNGLCGDNHICQCHEGFSGPFCDSKNCHTKEGSSRCSGHGTCENDGSCSCESGFSGVECQTSTAICENGFVTEDGDCQCYDNNEFTGPTCSIYKCPSSVHNLECSGHGICDDEIFECVCDNNVDNSNVIWSNPMCSSYTCMGSMADCSGHGECIVSESGSAKCICESGWGNFDCSNWFCFGLIRYDPNVCNGHGNCRAEQTCNCELPFTGDRCDELFCGAYSSASEEVCSSHGDCLYNGRSDSYCECYSGYGGPKCENSIGMFECEHGSWNHLTDRCDCDANYFGIACNVYGCNNVIYTDENNVCNGNGKCLMNEETEEYECQCNELFSGHDCSINRCYGIDSTDDNVCSGNGICMPSHLCVCLENEYTGLDCSIPLCNKIPKYHPESCNGNGDCISSDFCNCTFGYDGDFCEHPLCIGSLTNDGLPIYKYANEDGVCNGEGNCIDYMTCDCFAIDGFTGDHCQYSPASASAVGYASLVGSFMFIIIIIIIVIIVIIGLFIIYLRLKKSKGEKDLREKKKRKKEKRKKKKMMEVDDVEIE